MNNLITKTTLRLAMGLVVLLSVTTTSAGTVGRFQIPFQFLMGDKVLSAGDYTVKIDTANMSIQLASWEGSASVNLTADTPPIVWRPIPGNSFSTSTEGCWPFGRCGDPARTTATS